MQNKKPAASHIFMSNSDLLTFKQQLNGNNLSFLKIIIIRMMTIVIVIVNITSLVLCEDKSFATPLLASLYNLYFL